MGYYLGYNRVLEEYTEEYKRYTIQFKIRSNIMPKNYYITINPDGEVYLRKEIPIKINGNRVFKPFDGIFTVDQEIEGCMIDIRSQVSEKNINKKLDYDGEYLYSIIWSNYFDDLDSSYIEKVLIF